MCSLQEDFFAEDVMGAADDASSSGFEQDKKKRKKAAKRAKKAAKRADCATPAVGSRAKVWHGNAHHTSGGLTKADLMKNKHGEIVSKKKHAKAKTAMKKCKNPFSLVLKAMKAAGIKRERGADGRFKKLSAAQLKKLHAAMGVKKKACDKKKKAPKKATKKKQPCKGKAARKLLKKAKKAAK
jgi:hypothetical protein